MQARKKQGNASVIAIVMITGTILMAVGIYFTAMNAQNEPVTPFAQIQQETTATPAPVAAVEEDNDSGFRWLPKSDTGVVRVILPAVHAGDVMGCELMIHGLGMMETLEKGEPIGGETPTYTFSKSGANYPSPTYVVATLRDRTQVSWKVRKPSLRLRIDSEGEPMEPPPNQAVKAVDDKYSQTF